MKVIVLGIDGLMPQMLDDGISNGELTGFRELFAKGISFDLSSTFPAVSPVAWSTMITGLNPGKHGVYDFFSYTDLTKPQIANRKHLPFTIFDIASDYNKKVISINVPMTYPPWPINGLMLSGYPTPPGKVFTFPEIFSQNIDPSVLDFSSSFRLQAMERAVHTRGQFCIEQLQNSQWDLFMAAFRETDEAQHSHWGHDKEIMRLYRAIDKSFVVPMLEYIKTMQDEVAVIVLGDHGAMAGRGVFRFSDWLYSKDLIKTPHDLTHLFKFIIGRLYRLLEPTPFFFLISPVSNKKLFKIVTPNILPDSPVYSVGSLLEQACYIYVNDKSRIEEILAYIQKELAMGNLPLKVTVHKAEEFFTGPATKYAPHIILKTEEGYLSSPVFSGRRKNFINRLPWRRNGIHKKDTMLSLSLFPNGITNEYLKNRGAESGLKMEDVGALILWLLDIRAPKVMDGAVPDILYDLVQKRPETLRSNQNDLSYSIKVLKKAGVV